MSDEVPERLRAALADRYALERELGSGGMATVYLAHDLKHDREVAVKVLRPELAAVIGAERFLNEIRVTANLQHPHILPLFDSGEADGFLYYVMPYIKGESLRETLSREKQLPVEAAIQITRAVASALDYAHRHDVIHRDIKPANILLHDGQALVADFGIALAVTAAGGDRITETGLSLGTPEYMSPEQATGDRELDARSDVYSLGAVLYEMLAGDPPHTGPTVQAIIAKLVTERPRPVRELRDTVPIHVEAALDSALAQLPADRFATASDFADVLTGKVPAPAAADSLGVAVTVPPRPTVGFRGWRVALPWAVAIVAVGVAVWSLLRPVGGPQPVARYEIRLPDSAPLAFVGSAPLAVPRPSLAVSPDGSHVVYVAEREGNTQLFVRPIDRYEVEAIPGTEGAYHPFFAPDGQWIGFFASGELRKASLVGGQVVSLAPVRNPLGATWVSDDRIVLSVQEGVRLEAVSAAGGGVEAVEIATSDRHDVAWPEALPGGQAVLVSSWDGIMSTVSLATGEQTVLSVRGKNPRFLASGHLVYLGAGGLQAIAFDLDRLAVVGEPVPVPVPVRAEALFGAVHADGRDPGLCFRARDNRRAVSMAGVRRYDRVAGPAGEAVREFCGLARRNAARVRVTGADVPEHLGLRSAAGHNRASDNRRCILPDMDAGQQSARLR
jgi:serine/threonine-protein kinase